MTQGIDVIGAGMRCAGSPTTMLLARKGCPVHRPTHRQPAQKRVPAKERRIESLEAFDVLESERKPL